ncbi:MAG: hypothetical protein M1829_003470 [Trizodia sp. TS-e1964]|nr:MAG: hypothetical protein M1829_003470 [Trizodia sp. TS-e1964]
MLFIVGWLIFAASATSGAEFQGATKGVDANLTPRSNSKAAGFIIPGQGAICNGEMRVFEYEEYRNIQNPPIDRGCLIASGWYSFDGRTPCAIYRAAIVNGQLVIMTIDPEQADHTNPNPLKFCHFTEVSRLVSDIKFECTLSEPPPKSNMGFIEDGDMVYLKYVETEGSSKFWFLLSGIAEGNGMSIPLVVSSEAGGKIVGCKRFADVRTYR